MNLDQIDRMVRQANPVPDPTVLEGVARSDLLSGLQARTEPQSRDQLDIDLQLIDWEHNDQRQKRRRWPIIAAAAVVAIVAGALVLAAQDDSSEPQLPADQPTTVPPERAAAAVETATGFLDAWSAYDTDRMMSFLTDDAIAEVFDSAEGLRLKTLMSEAQGFKATITGCQLTQPAATAAGIDVRCGYDYHALGSDRIGLGPFTGNYWDLIVGDGEIISASEFNAFASNGFEAQMWDHFARWVSEAHPAAADMMYTDSTRSTPRINEQSITIWAQRTQMYVASSVQAAYDRGLVGLPPEGATPSAPEHGELVDSYWASRGDYRFASYVRLYADGRLIWFMWLSNDGYPGNGRVFRSSGWLEQRLTPEGVELVRTHDNVEEKAPWLLHEWLPPSAWQDPQLKAYVSFEYAACLSLSDAHATIQDYETEAGRVPTEQLLALLPTEAADLLRGRQTVPTTPGAREGATPECLALTADEARQLDRALSDAGVPQQEIWWYAIDYPGEDGAVLGIVFEPVFPDGRVACSQCG